jgi:hypothetical protein
MVMVDVLFVPTLAVNNITVDETGNKIGGSVMVVSGDIDHGNLRSCSDGVPALGGRPYVSTSVYGIAEEGFTTDLSNITVRNLNDFNCPAVILQPDENGFFTAQLPTVIAGVPDVVEKSGRITKGSILIEFDGLPVPLQVDLRFIPAASDDPDGDDPDDPDTPGDPNEPGTPGDPNNPGDPNDPDDPGSSGGFGTPGSPDDPNNPGGGTGPGEGGSDSSPGGGDSPHGESGNADSTSGQGLPRTGIESVISTLLTGLITSIVAGAMVLLVIRRMNAKERKALE